jgi:DNA-binding transcriptional MerR regulator
VRRDALLPVNNSVDSHLGRGCKVEIVEELMTIGAFARRTGLSVSALRFYADRGLLVPADTDRASGYRRYANHQVADGLLISDLRRLEMPLSDIALALAGDERERNALVNGHLRQLERSVVRAHTIARCMGAIDPTTERHMSSATLAAPDLAAALDQVLPAAGTDLELPHLMSVLIEGAEGSIRLVATDRHRLAVRDLVPIQFDGEFRAIVAVATLQRWRTALTDQQETTLSVNDGVLSLHGAGADLVATAMPVTFPDYERFLDPIDDATTAQVDRQQLLDVLRSAKARVDGDEIIISVTAAGLQVQIGDTATELDAGCEGPDQRVVLNVDYAIDAVGGAVGPELVIEVDDESSPVLFRSADHGTFTSRIMPIRHAQPAST